MSSSLDVKNKRAPQSSTPSARGQSSVHLQNMLFQIRLLPSSSSFQNYLKDLTNSLKKATLDLELSVSSSSSTCHSMTTTVEKSENASS